MQTPLDTEMTRNVGSANQMPTKGLREQRLARKAQDNLKGNRSPQTKRLILYNWLRMSLFFRGF
jgi:hypothetical protein